MSYFDDNISAGRWKGRKTRKGKFILPRHGRFADMWQNGGSLEERRSWYKSKRAPIKRGAKRRQTKPSRGIM